MLRDVEGMSTSETAESLGINEDTVKTRLFRARAQLRRHLTAQIGVEAPGAFQFHATRRRCSNAWAACSRRRREGSTGARRLTSSERAELLFYLPDGIAPWPAQPVRWVLDFTWGLFGGTRRRGRSGRRSSGSLRSRSTDRYALERPAEASAARDRPAHAAAGAAHRRAVRRSRPAAVTRRRRRRFARTRRAAGRSCCRSIRSAMPRESAIDSCCSATAACAARARSRS